MGARTVFSRAAGAFRIAGALVLLAAAAYAEDVKLSPRPRVILNPARLEKLRNLAKAGNARAKALGAWGDANLHSKTAKYLEPGYAREGWAEYAENYALAYLIEGDAAKRQAYAAEALVYMKALADDSQTVGDGAGGMAPVEAEGGYAIRNHAVGVATCYDWLYDYQGLTPQLKAHFVERLDAWIDWYAGAGGGKGGYQAKGKPWDSYFAAYYQARTLAAVATYEDNAKARGAYLHDAVAAMRNDILPALSRTLAGGYPPDGWYYRCGYDRIVDALLTLSNATGEKFDANFFAYVVRAAIHSTTPDRRRIYDGGDWGGDFSGYPLPLPLMARLSLLLSGSPAGAYALYYVNDFAQHDRSNNISLLDNLLYIDPYAERVDFTKTEPLSYFSPGTGLATFRSSWSDGAFWAAFQSGSPRLADHQNRDQGHITLEYLDAPLLIDSGNWREVLPGGKVVKNFASDTAWHNTIMIDNLGRGAGLSQGAYGDGRTLAFEDAAAYVYVSADITGAYAGRPSTKAANCAKKVTRDVLYIRPATVVVMDQVEPLEADYPRSVIFNFPFAASPKSDKISLAETVGGATLKLFPVSPPQQKMDVYKQFGTREDDKANDVYTWGLRLPGKTGDAMSRFLTVLSAAASDKEGRFAGFAPVFGGPNAVVLTQDKATTAVIWATRGSKSFEFQLPAAEAVDLYVVGMEPAKTYALKVLPQGQTLAVTIEQAPNGRLSSPAGVICARVAARPKPNQSR